MTRVIALSLGARRARRWPPFLSGVVIGLVCWLFVGYAVASALV